MTRSAPIIVTIHYGCDQECVEKARWFQRTTIVAIAFPYIAAIFGWILTEMGRQPWIVQTC